MSSDINVSATAADLDRLAQSVTSLAAVFESEFGKMTKRVNLFGTNVAKRLERISAAVDSVGDSLKNAGGGLGEGMASGMDQVAASAAAVGGSVSGLGGSLSSVGSGASSIGSGIASVGAGILGVGDGIASVGSGIAALGGGFSSAASGLSALGTALPQVGNGFVTLGVQLSSAMQYGVELLAFVGILAIFGQIGAQLSQAGAGALSLGTGMLNMATALSVAAGAMVTLATALPLLGAGFAAFLVALAPTLEYVPQLLIFVGLLTALSFLGEGLMAAGIGLSGVAVGFAEMGAALPVLNEGITQLINGLMNTTANIGGIITLVLLSAAMLILAISLQKINEHLAPMVKSMGELQDIFSIGLIVGISVFTVMMLLLALTMNKVASGVDKVTSAMKKQCTQLAILIPMQATSAILSNPIVGAITVAAATAAGLLMMAFMPKMATGGVVGGPTVAMIGEGKYPEAVIPLGSSPQFASMKADIASAVLQGLTGLRTTGGAASAPVELVLSLDGEKFARAVIPAIDRENRRKGMRLSVREG